MAKDTRIGERMLLANSLPGLTGNERAVLVALAYHDGPNGCFPSDDTLVAESGVRHRSAVRHARNGLRRKGRLRWTHGQHTNVYELAYVTPFDFEPQWPGNSASGQATTEPQWPGNSALSGRESVRLSGRESIQSLAGKLGHEPEGTGRLNPKENRNTYTREAAAALEGATARPSGIPTTARAELVRLGLLKPRDGQ